MSKKCSCPLNCLKCGRSRSRDQVGHYCKTKNCQYQHGYPDCSLLPRDPDEIPWYRWYAQARDKAKEHDLCRVPRDTYREQWAQGLSVQQGVRQILIRHGRA